MATELRADIEAAKNLLTIKIGGGREIKRLAEHLWDGETVERLAVGTYGGGQGLIVLTDRRLFFVKDGRMRQTSEDFPFGSISSIQWDAKAMVGSIVVFAMGNKAEIASVNKNDGKPIVDAVRGRLSSSGSVSPVAPVAGSDVITQLRQLGDLRDAGVVTTDEFEAKKAELLKRI